MLIARVISAIVFFAFFFLGLFNPLFVWALPLLLAVAALSALKEFAHFTPQRPRPSFVWLAYGAALLMLADAYYYELDHALAILGLLTVISLGWGTLSLERDSTSMAGVCLIGTLYVTLPLALITIIWRTAVQSNNQDGQHYIIFLVLGTQASDVGAYFIGRLLGRHKMAPRISPGKSWEGFAGGVAFTLLLAVLAKLFWNNIDRLFGWYEIVGFALVFSMVGPVGDLAESWLKRTAGIKDSGRTFTGHGGVLDIIDSLLFTTIIYYIYLGLSPRHEIGIF
ncbi:MAG TPA: phosphatidate cytidylyltransferase [Candidatus Sumerlaeota bacterium]|nr:phosphatidate cytidylyltransferase [Candidatus Sumerlaeota bacterium]